MKHEEESSNKFDVLHGRPSGRKKMKLDDEQEEEEELLNNESDNNYDADINHAVMLPCIQLKCLMLVTAGGYR